MTQTMQRTAAAPRPPSAARAPDGTRSGGLLVYVLLGVFFGIALVKSEVISWFRIQEMFRFQSFHMYGVIGSAVTVAALSVALIRRLGVRTLRGEEIVIPPKEWGKAGTRYWAGGTLFGFGWALTGACPGPLFALLGAGVGVIAFVIVAAIAGAWVYGALRPRLPH
jgi:uncharacterized membrane protein YedE/YeeE